MNRTVLLLLATAALGTTLNMRIASAETVVRSPNARNVIRLASAANVDERVRFSVSRDGDEIIQPSTLGPTLATGEELGMGARIVQIRRGQISDRFELPWGKASNVHHHCSFAVMTLTSASDIRWEVEIRAYDDGVAFRYRIPMQGRIEIRDEGTEFNLVDNPNSLFNSLAGFTTSHESLYEHRRFSEIPVQKLLDMPVLFTWPRGHAAAITEARVLRFAGAYLQRPAEESMSLRIRLSPLPARDGVAVVGQTPLESPWRVILLADHAGQLHESNLLQCLNDPPKGDFSWLKAGKTTWHWWYGAFEDDHELPQNSDVSLNRHRNYIDFCARNNIAYHAVSGDGFAWYQQSKTGYGNPMADADVRVPRAKIRLPEIIEYSRERGVGIRLWVHWIPLSEHLEEAFTLYESWGVKGIMVDFLNRDDQEMNDFTERMLASAARHRLHVQVHGSPKYSGEQRTFPHLFNREGVLNLEFLKWGDLCTPAHNVNVAYTRALAGPVDYHQGGFRSVSRAQFRARDRAPEVMGTRCHHLALYVVYENPMPMVSDVPDAYEGQAGFEFIKEVPTTWDETRFLVGEPGEFVVLARRKAATWYIGGITNWSGREIEVPMEFLSSGEYEADCWVDGSMDESHPNEVTRNQTAVTASSRLKFTMASGGGFVAVVRAK